MSEKHTTSGNSRTLSDRRLDELMAAFFDHEMPVELREPVMPVRALRAKPSLPTVAAAHGATSAPSSLRGFTAIAAMLAACAILVMASWNFPTAPGRGTAVVSGDAESNGDLMDVSSNPSADIPVDDNQTSLQEIEQIDLSPGEDSAPQTPSRASQDGRRQAPAGQQRGVE
ncbi:MAG: hypothetical protein R3C19_14920 [Planctomycetaceae bacterium]